MADLIATSASSGQHSRALPPEEVPSFLLALQGDYRRLYELVNLGHQPLYFFRYPCQRLAFNQASWVFSHPPLPSLPNRDQFQLARQEPGLSFTTCMTKR